MEFSQSTIHGLTSNQIVSYFISVCSLQSAQVSWWKPKRIERAKARRAGGPPSEGPTRVLGCEGGELSGWNGAVSTSLVAF